MGGFYDLRGRRSKIIDGGVLLSSAPKIVDGGFYDLRSRKIEQGPGHLHVSLWGKTTASVVWFWVRQVESMFWDLWRAGAAKNLLQGPSVTDVELLCVRPVVLFAMFSRKGLRRSSIIGSLAHATLSIHCVCTPK